eukprot:gene21188-41169_t
MKRFHVHMHVDDLAKSIAFYSRLFAAEPARVETDYAKWMLEDPRVNFAISTRGDKPGVDHLGFQVDEADELAELKARAQGADMALLDWLEQNMDALRAREPGALAHAVRRSCEIKAEVVGQDEREAGLRAILNFGHTFGHAIEAGLGYGEWLHGEAVGCGMVMAARLSQRLGGVDAAFVERLT